VGWLKLPGRSRQKTVSAMTNAEASRFYMRRGIRAEEAGNYERASFFYRTAFLHDNNHGEARERAAAVDQILAQSAETAPTDEDDSSPGASPSTAHRKRGWTERYLGVRIR
jgi:hypothetical protein